MSHLRMKKPAMLGAALLTTIAVMASCGEAPVATSTSASGSPSSVTSSDSGLTPKGETVSAVPVTRVVDGDTLHVRLDGKDTTVRMIGINTPETVKENSPIECYGPEASDYAKHNLTGQTITLEFDDSQGRYDQYGRTLAYVWLEEGSGGLTLVNLDEVAGGYARERQYGPTPYAWKSTFRAAQADAKAAGAGLWGACPVP